MKSVEISEKSDTFTINFSSSDQKKMWKKKNPKVLRYIENERDAEVTLDGKALDMVLGMDEGVADFIGAASKAKAAGKKEFEFEGETYPVKISDKVAKKVSKAMDEGTYRIPFPTHNYHVKSNAQLKSISENSFKQSVRVRFTNRELGQQLINEANIAESILNWRLYGKGSQGMPMINEKKKLDSVDQNAIAKKFDDRKDKDIDNDGDVDDSDRYLHKRRKAISKAIKKEEKYEKEMEEESLAERNEKPDEKTIEVLKNIAKTGKTNMWKLVEPYWIGSLPSSDDHDLKTNMSAAKRILKKYGVKESVNEEKLNPKEYVYTSDPINDKMGVVVKISGAKPYHAAIVNEKDEILKDVGKFSSIESAQKMLSKKKLYENVSYNYETGQEELEPRSPGEKKFKDQHILRKFDPYTGKYDDELEMDEEDAQEDDEDLMSESVEDIDITRLSALVRSGLIGDDKLSLIKRSVRKLSKDSKITQPQEREILFDLVKTLLSLVTTDTTIYQKVKRMVNEGINEKSVSQQQQKLMGLAYSYKKGEVPESEVSDEVKKIADTMSMKDLKDFASTKHKGLPKKIQEAVDDVLDEEDVDENIMMLRQLHFIQYAAEEIIDYFDMGYEVEPWFENKVSGVHEKVKGLHAYIEGDKRLQDMINNNEQ